MNAIKGRKVEELMLKGPPPPKKQSELKLDPDRLLFYV